MRIHSVGIAGFGPFLAPQHVDFEAFAGHGIFLVQGPTGAGKSSILDAVVYALYNSVPRYGSRGAEQLRSQHCGPGDATWVELDFTVDGQRYRVRRSPEYERPKARGEGLTTERATATLWRRDGEDWVGVESSLRAVGQALHELLPLTRTQFLQVVMLAQGQFERFLVAESAERKELLGALFDTRRFDDFDRALQRRVVERQSVLDRATSTTDALVAALAGQIGVEPPESPDATWLEEIATSCREAAATADAARDRAQAVLEEKRAEVERRRDLLARQRRLAELRARHETLRADLDAVEALRVRLRKAEAARAVRPSWDACLGATRRCDDLAGAVTKAELRYEEVFGDSVPEALGEQRDRLVAAVPTVERAAGVERRLVEATAELKRRSRSLNDLDLLQERLAEEAEVHQQVLDRAVEATPEAAERAVHELLEEVARARRFREGRTARIEAQRIAVVAGEGRTRASATLDDLRRRSLEQSAGRLAETLEPGEPCQVCGSTVHPDPATRGGDPVRDEDITAAEQAFDRAQQAVLRAEADLAAARTNEMAHRSSMDLETATVELQAASDRHARLVEVEKSRSRAQDALARIGEEQQRAEVSRASLTAGLEALSTSVDALQGEVEEARAGAETVAERLETLRSQLRAVEGLLTSRQGLRRGEDERSAAEQRLGHDLAHHGFSDVEEFVAAELPPPEVEELRSRLRRHDESWTVTVAALADPELQGLPADAVELTEAVAALDRAVEAHDETAGAAGVARQQLVTAEGFVAQIREAWMRHADDLRELEGLRRLAATVHGESPNTRRLRLESYVLAVELEEIVLAANRRLAAMTTGRYELLLNDRVATRGNNAGLEVRVLDQHTQATRTPESLSGGEKFLASLALALGLAEVVTQRAGGVTLDTLFVDEGFGSLDAETLDLAMHTLDQLREHGRTVGVISHVEAMKERIPAQLVVDRVVGGWSTTRVLV